MVRRLRKWIVRGAIVALFFYTPIASVNPASRLALVESLLSRGTPETGESPFFNRLDMVQYRGHFYSDKPPLLALYSTAVLAPVHGPLDFDDGPAGKVLYWIVVASASGLALLILALVTRSMRRSAASGITWGWLAAAVIGGTCVLPFARTYNDHVVEAAILLAVFMLLRRRSSETERVRALAVGALIGVAWLLHPLVGSVSAASTGLYYLARREGGTVARRFVVGAIFLVGATSTVALGTAAHVALYDRAAPFYFSPELYLWTDGPGGVESHWLSEPTTPGLTAGKIVERFEVLGLPEARLQETLSLYAAHQESVRNPLRFAAARYFRYGQLTFAPLVLFCLFLSAAAVIGRRDPRRDEILWVLVSVAGLVLASVALRAVPGGSFGDRHLLPAAPLLVVAGGLAATTARETSLFRALTLVSVAIILPGAMAPWVTPGDVFLAANLGLSAIAVSIAVLIWKGNETARVGAAWSRWVAALSRARVFALFAGFALLQVLLYLGTLPTE